MKNIIIIITVLFAVALTQCKKETTTTTTTPFSGTVAFWTDHAEDSLSVTFNGVTKGKRFNVAVDSTNCGSTGMVSFTAQPAGFYTYHTTLVGASGPVEYGDYYLIRSDDGALAVVSDSNCISRKIARGF